MTTEIRSESINRFEPVRRKTDVPDFPDGWKDTGLIKKLRFKRKFDAAKRWSELEKNGLDQKLGLEEYKSLFKAWDDVFNYVCATGAGKASYKLQIKLSSLKQIQKKWL